MQIHPILQAHIRRAICLGAEGNTLSMDINFNSAQTIRIYLDYRRVFLTLFFNSNVQPPAISSRMLYAKKIERCIVCKYLFGEQRLDFHEFSSFANKPRARNWKRDIFSVSPAEELVDIIARLTLRPRFGAR